MKNKDFTYTSENYSEKNIMDHGNYLNCPAHYGDIKPFLNGVSPIFKSPLDDSLSIDEQIKGKTIDYNLWDETNGNIFIGFTDGTFIIRRLYERGEMDGYKQRFWGYCASVPSHFCVFDGEKYYAKEGGDYGTGDFDTFVVKITGIGRWLEEHTDANIIGFYEKVKKERLEILERIKKDNEERDKKTFNYLKEKYNW